MITDTQVAKEIELVFAACDDGDLPVWTQRAHRTKLEWALPNGGNVAEYLRREIGDARQFATRLHKHMCSQEDAAHWTLRFHSIFVAPAVLLCSVVLALAWMGLLFANPTLAAPVTCCTIIAAVYWAYICYVISIRCAAWRWQNAWHALCRATDRAKTTAAMFATITAFKHVAAGSPGLTCLTVPFQCN